MSDYLGNIATKSLSVAPNMRPRPVSLFEPVHTAGTLRPAQGVFEKPLNGLSGPGQVETTEMQTAGSVQPRQALESEAKPATPSPFSSDALEARGAVYELYDPSTRIAQQTDQNTMYSASDVSEVVIQPEPLGSVTVDMPALTPFQEARLRKETMQDDVSTMKTLPAGEQRRPRVKPSIERVAIDLSGVSVNEGLTGIVSVSRDNAAPSFRTKETMPVQSSPAPTIQVTIGRIEIRATTLAIPSQKQQQAPKTMSLDEYLGKHNGGR